MPELAIVIPAYNEARALPILLSAWERVLDGLNIDYRIHILDDGSTDRTYAEARSAQADNPRIQATTRANQGHGPTILSGYAVADAGWVMQIDGDEILGLAEFPALWAERDAFDCIFGVRTDRRNPLSRRLLTRSAALLTRCLFSAPTPDANCPFRLMRATFLRRALPLIPPDAFAPNVILTGLAYRFGLRVRQAPVTYQGDRNLRSSLKTRKLLGIALAAARSMIRAARAVRKSG